METHYTPSNLDFTENGHESAIDTAIAQSRPMSYFSTLEEEWITFRHGSEDDWRTYEYYQSL